MKLKLFTVKMESYRYGDLENEVITRFSNRDSAGKLFEEKVGFMRQISHLTEYEPNCFIDSDKRWSYETKIYDEVIEICETEEGELLNQLIVESRKNKIKKITE